MRFSPVWGINLIPYTVCKSRLCRRILSRLRADLRENPTKQWASRDTLIQSAGSISNSARYHSDANIALGPILKMYIPGQIRISNALNSDGYSTGNAPPSGNNIRYSYGRQWKHIFDPTDWVQTLTSTMRSWICRGDPWEYIIGILYWILYWHQTLLVAFLLIAKIVWVKYFSKYLI